MSGFVCFLIALVVSLIVGAILMVTNLLGLGKLLWGMGFPKFIVILFEFIIIVILFCFTFNFSYKMAKDDYENVYFTTLKELKYYEKIEKAPLGKDIGVVPIDSVLCVKHFTHKDDITWLESYILTSSGNPKKIYVLVPLSIKRADRLVSTDFYIYNETSKSFQAYFDRIDNENKITKKEIQKAFKDDLNNRNIIIQKSTDVVLKASIKETAFILPSYGYIDLFVSRENEFYYIPIEQKKEFQKCVGIYEQRLYNETKKYFKD